MSTLIGAQLDNYRIVEQIGEGGMGAVYRATDVMLERDVALKFLRPELSREPELVQRFRSEAVLLARLNHHFIAPIYGLHRYGDELFIAMEYVPGATLDARLKTLGRFEADAAMHVTSMLLQALDYAHRLGVIHRDIKPGNVILSPEGTLKVMDFGIARVLGAQRQTRAGSIVGTIAYMAPEQIQGLDTDQRADLYSVGIVLYEMLTGHVPFRADTDWALMQAQIAEAPRPLRDEVEVPGALEDAVLRALEKSRDRRYQTANEFHRDLERAAREVARQQVGYVAPDPGSVAGQAAPTRLTGAPPVASWEETRVGMQTPTPRSMAMPLPIGVPAPRTEAGGTGAAGADMTRVALPLSSPGAADPVAGATSEPATPPRPQAEPRRPAGARRRGIPWLAVGALLLVAAGAAAGWFAWQRSQGSPAGPIEAETAAMPSDGVPPVPAEAPGATASAPAGTDAITAAPTPPPAGVARPGAASPDAPGRAASGRRPSETPPPAVGRNATPASPAVTSAPDRAESAPAATSEPPAALPPTAAADEDVFKGLRLMRRGAPEVEIELHLGPSQVALTNVGGRHVLHTLPYGMIATAEYHESRHQRVFVRTTRHWLTLTGRGGRGVLLRLDREAVPDILAAFEKRWGRKVVTTTPQDERP